MNRFWTRIIAKTETFLRGYAGEAPDNLVFFRSSGYFLVSSACCGLAGCAVGLKWNWLIGIIGFLCGMCIPAVLLYLSNEQDNVIILKELKWLYETVSVQLQAGLHIRQALVESEGLMKNKRLRTSLHTLTERLINGEDMTLALEHFESSFRNRYISSFCVILKQMQDSGYGVKLLDDIRIQIEEMERVQLAKKKEALETWLQLFEMLLFIGIMVLVMYGCVLAALQNMSYL